MVHSSPCPVSRNSLAVRCRYVARVVVPAAVARWLGGGQCRVSEVGDEPFQHTYAGPDQKSEMNNWLNFRREVKNRLNMTKGPKDNDNEFQVLHLSALTDTSSAGHSVKAFYS